MLLEKAEHKSEKKKSESYREEWTNHYWSPEVKWKITPSPTMASGDTYEEYCQSDSGKGENVN